MKRNGFGIGLALIGILFLVHLFIIDDYSINWDFHHVFFAGLYHLKHPVPGSLWHYLPFVDPDPRRMVETPFGPLQSYVPALSYTIFFEKLKLLAFDSAWNLPAVVMGVGGILVLYLFMFEAFRLRNSNDSRMFVPLASLIILALYPRYWGDLHTNVKDITTASMYTISIWLAWRMVNKRRLIDVILAGLAAGITFNFKVNAIFIPIIVALWVLWLLVTAGKKYLEKPFSSLKDNIIIPIGGYAILASLSAYLIWAIFWVDPYNHLAYLIRFFQYNTINMEVLLNGSWFCSGVNVPWYYPFVFLSVVTPLPVLLFFLIGMMKALHLTLKKHDTLAPLLLLWFIVPLLRFMTPNASVIDGIRHFEEIVFPLSAIAAIGAYTIVNAFNHLTIQPFSHYLKKYFLPGLAIAVFLYLIYPIILYHPYQLSYYNELVGGIKGAMGKYDIDYWGISQKRAVEWLNQHAPKNAVVHIVMTGDTAGKYLRPDLLVHLNTTDWDHADYVLMLNRQTFFYRYFFSYEYMLFHKPVHIESVSGVPLSWVFDNKLGITPRQTQWWTGEDVCMRKYW